MEQVMEGKWAQQITTMFPPSGVQTLGKGVGDAVLTEDRILSQTANGCHTVYTKISSLCLPMAFTIMHT